ncbi:hypothetical protein OESDEN_10885 [Oesophagostomum dentatum]|uniref:RNA polymerase II-associated factor 1 homolog n=1 Tax=Oesophagostomum dentatum TaxID=61180 RepID=A0A0B1SWE7_OESDE|nr:hypothetical protein OESDEN_10885 [Oesophagostomum dentatum]
MSQPNHKPGHKHKRYEHILNREYTWTVKNKNTKGFERDNYFVYYKDGIFHYNELETKVRLARRRRAGHDKPNTQLHVTYTEPTEAEVQTMTNRMNSLLKNYDSDDEAEEKPSESHEGTPKEEKAEESHSEKEGSTDNEKDGSDDDDSDDDKKKSESEKGSTDESD